MCSSTVIHPCYCNKCLTKTNRAFAIKVKHLENQFVMCIRVTQKSLKSQEFTKGDQPVGNKTQTWNINYNFKTVNIILLLTWILS